MSNTNQNSKQLKSTSTEPELTNKELETLFTRPELLLHPNIPKPLHGLAPRTLMKVKDWDVVRRAAYAKNNYHCWACGDYRNYDLARNKFDDERGTLDAHEFYAVDYKAKTVKLIEIVALCKNCHNYIHSGRYNSMYDKGRLDEEDMWIVNTHGDSVLIDGGLVPIDNLDTNTYEGEWNEWRLVLEYKSKWKDYWDWYGHYLIG